MFHLDSDPVQGAARQRGGSLSQGALRPEWGQPCHSRKGLAAAQLAPGQRGGGCQGTGVKPQQVQQRPRRAAIPESAKLHQRPQQAAPRGSLHGVELATVFPWGTGALQHLLQPWGLGQGAGIPVFHPQLPPAHER